MRFCPRGGTGRLGGVRMRTMSYDLAVWEGDRPSDDKAAAEEFQRLYEQYIDSDVTVAPTPRIAAYARTLLDRYPDISPSTGDDSPWSTGPLINEASGPVMYFPMVWSRCEEISAWAAQVAAEQGLNCYDPQRDQLRTEPADRWRFELTNAHKRRFRDPDAETIRRVLTRLSRDAFYATMTRADGWYVQVGFGTRAGTRPGTYALERQDGGTDRHFRTELTDIEDVVRAFVAFRDEDPTTLQARYAWHAHTL